jgi:hypothetical protein
MSATRDHYGAVTRSAYLCESGKRLCRRHARETQGTEGTAHSACTHPATPAARRTCRELRHMARYAESLGLAVKDTSDQYAAQMTFVHPEDRWYDTRITWTRCWDRNRYDFTIRWASGEEGKRERGKANLEGWLRAISPKK